MTAAGFASISSSILARKGEAKPWEEPAKKTLAWRPDLRHPEQVFPNFSRSAELWNRMPPESLEPPVVTKIPVPEPPPKIEYKKLSLRFTPEEYEQWGILAIKKGTTRQHLLQQAVAQAFTTLAKDYGQCACLGQCGRCSATNDTSDR